MALSSALARLIKTVAIREVAGGMDEEGYIQKITSAAQGQAMSVNWYKKKIKELGTPKAMDLIRDGKRKGKPHAGKLNMFFYDPKYKETLPYYDTFPLVLPIEKYSNGFLGLNLHYLPIPLRIRLLDRLAGFSEGNEVNVDYNGLKNISLVKTTLHKYLYGQTKSQFRRIDVDEFVVAAMLPVQIFKKASASKVWGDSRSMI